MSRVGTRRLHQRSQSGYALLLAVFLVASLLLFAAAAVPSVLVQGRREREEDAVWRGKQYMRAIRLYYQKNGMFPQTIEDLAKPNAANIHFLRKAYADPTNRVDGKWRGIYVSPAGQLIGSVRYHTLQEMALAQQGLLIPPSGGSASGAGAPAQQQSGQQSPQTAGQQSPQTAGQQSGQFGGQQMPSGLSAGPAQPASLVPLAPVDGPVMGANLIGVAGKTKSPSLLVYQGGKTYQEWEFIWNPLTGANGQLPGATGAPAAAPAGAAGVAAPPSQNPFDNPTSTNFPPGSQPQVTTTPAP